MKTYVLTPTEAELAFRQVSSHCEALKNWIVSRVECGDLPIAQELAKELNDYRTLYAKLNVEAHKMIDEAAK